MIWTPHKLNKIEIRRRELLLAALASGAYAAVPTPLWAMGRLPRELPPGKSVYKVDGKVLVDNKQATLDTRVEASSKIQTGKNGTIIFAVGHDAMLLRSNSILQLSGDKSNLLVKTMRLVSGKLLTVFGKSPHTVNTDVATIGIRGTGVYVEAELDQTYVCTCYGTADLIPKANPDDQRTVTTFYHESPRYLLAKPLNGKYVAAAPVINHTDEELILIEELLGRRPPFMKGYKGGGGSGGSSY